MSKRDEYVKKMKHQLDELNASLDALEAKRDAASAEVRAKYDERMGELRAHAKKASLKMEELKEAGEDKWEALMDEGEKLQKAFKSSFNYFKSQL
jgi:uncharacterized coiled-coil DUF342 family protein